MGIFWSLFFTLLQPPFLSFFEVLLQNATAIDLLIIILVAVIPIYYLYVFQLPFSNYLIHVVFSVSLFFFFYPSSISLSFVVIPLGFISFVIVSLSESIPFVLFGWRYVICLYMLVICILILRLSFIEGNFCVVPLVCLSLSLYSYNLTYSNNRRTFQSRVVFRTISEICLKKPSMNNKSFCVHFRAKYNITRVFHL